MALAKPLSRRTVLQTRQRQQSSCSLLHKQSRSIACAATMKQHFGSLWQQAAGFHLPPGLLESNLGLGGGFPFPLWPYFHNYLSGAFQKAVVLLILRLFEENKPFLSKRKKKQSRPKEGDYNYAGVNCFKHLSKKSQASYKATTSHASPSVYSGCCHDPGTTNC